MNETLSNNQDTQVAWEYHQGTKHPGGRLMNSWHSYDPSRRPFPFKLYPDLEPIPLTLDKNPIGMSALSAMSMDTPIGETAIPDVEILARLLYFSAGITKRITYTHYGEMTFRAAACTGALYHIELYLVCQDLPGLEAGVYHFDPQGFGLKQLRQGNYRGVLVAASGSETAVVHAPAILVYTDIFWRNACKYQSREYRHAFWDSGTILSQTLAMASAQELPARIVAGFVDQQVNQLLGLDTDREVSLALVPIGYTPEKTKGETTVPKPLALETGPLYRDEIDFPPIREMHEASSLVQAEEVHSWRGDAPVMASPEPEGDLILLEPFGEEEMAQDPVETVIIRRGSTRQFAREPIQFRQLSTILSQAFQGITADFLKPPGATLNHVYLIVNAVEGLEPGAYFYHQDKSALERLNQGNFRGDAGHLALGQDLAADASVNIYFLTDLDKVLPRFGNRGYRAAQLEASIAAGRIYLASYAQRIGATGLTFYDDAVTKFFSPHGNGKSVMFLVAIGHKARQS